MSDSNINVLIVEDEWITSEEIKEVLEGNGFLVVGQADNAEDALEIVRNHPVDIALLDINIKGAMDGIELAKEISSIRTTGIVFLTAFDDSAYLERAKQVVPAAYLVKPFQSKNLVISIEMAFNSLSKDESESAHEGGFVVDDRIFIKENHLLVRILIQDIMYAEAVGSYTKIHTNNRTHVLAINLKAFEKKLGQTNFIRVHRSYLVNVSRIEAINGNLIYIGNTSIPISSGLKSEVLQRFRII